MTETVIENSRIIQRIHKYHQQLFNKLDQSVRTTLSKPLSELQSSRHILFAGLGSSGLSATVI